MKRQTQSPLISRYGGILLSSASELHSEDQLSLCIRRLFASFEALAESESAYSKYMDLHVLQSGECNAFVMPVGGRCKIFFTIGLIAAALQASRISVSRSTLPAVATGSTGGETIPEEFVAGNAAAMRSLGLRDADMENRDQSRDNLALPIAQAILDFILHHEFMHISMGHVAYNWKVRSESSFLEFGSTGLSRDQCKIRTSFELAADATAALLGCDLVFEAQSPFECVSDSLPQKLEWWAYSVCLMGHLLWKLSNSEGPDQLMKNAMTLEDKNIHPDPIKRRFNIQAVLLQMCDPDTAEGRTRNSLVDECFNLGLSKEYSATEKTSLHVKYDPKQLISFMQEHSNDRNLGGAAEKNLWKRLFAPKDGETLMVDPGDWLTEMHKVAEKIEPTLVQVEREFRERVLTKQNAT